MATVMMMKMTVITMMKMMTRHKEIGELSNSRYLFIVTGDFCN